MPLPEHLEELTLSSFSTPYKLFDDKVKYCGHDVRGAHIPTFRFFAGGFAKDHKNCYSSGSKLKNANPATFLALNFTYATDGNRVWTMGGEIKDVDAATFEVCDDGAYTIRGDCIVPFGYGKDKQRVFYYDFDGKPNCVRKAITATFISLNDGYFGKDQFCVFCGYAALPKVKVEHWKKIGGYYSKDNSRVYYFNRLIAGADYDTFAVVPTGKDHYQMARDKNSYYANDRIVSEFEFNEELSRCFKAPSKQ
jgi:hypothetical protein